MSPDSPPRCSSCAAPLAPDARFCSRCGERVPRGAPDVADVAGEPQHETELAQTEPSPGRGLALPPLRLARGTMLHGYRVEGVLGEGGMGVVYRAHDVRADREVALKCLHTNLAGDPQIRQRFTREARVLTTWKHPGAVAVYDFLEHEHLLAIVMELVRGESLAAYLARSGGRLAYDVVASVFADVLATMQAAHDAGIVHRDLKPDNLLVATERTRLVPKVVDFGLAKMLDGTTYTMSGALLGTCLYMAPEQVKTPSAADHRADIYSLGVTLYEVVTGRTPFDADGGHFAVMMAHVSQRPRSPSKLRADVPPALERLILDALAKDPAARPASCEAFRTRLLEALGPAAG